MDIQKVIDDALEYARPQIADGELASYIPELAKVNPDYLGICVKTVDGSTYQAGDAQVEFTMQSISKTMSLIMALELVGPKEFFSKVGMEPTGDAFNSIVKLETKVHTPLNPMINAGAIVTASFCAGAENAFDHFLGMVQRFCGREHMTINESVYLSEKKAGDRNRSMAYLMQTDHLLACDVETTLDLYFRMCSVNTTTEDLANYAMLLANDGVNPVTGERIIESWITRVVKTLMMTCGMYDGSGEFAIRVGIPAKSGVGGGIIATLDKSPKKKMGIAAFSPALDDKGNSIGAYQMIEYLSKTLDLHFFSGSDSVEF